VKEYLVKAKRRRQPPPLPPLIRSEVVVAEPAEPIEQIKYTVVLTKADKNDGKVKKNTFKQITYK